MAKRKKEKSLLAKTSWRLFGLALFCWLLSLLAAVMFYDMHDAAYNTASSQPVKNLLGLYGANSADMMLTWLGLALPVFLIAPLIWAYNFMRLRELIHPYWRFFAFVFGTVCFAVMLSLCKPFVGEFKTGGNIGLFCRGSL